MILLWQMWSMVSVLFICSKREDDHPQDFKTLSQVWISIDDTRLFPHWAHLVKLGSMPGWKYFFPLVRGNFGDHLISSMGVWDPDSDSEDKIKWLFHVLCASHLIYFSCLSCVCVCACACACMHMCVLRVLHMYVLCVCVHAHVCYMCACVCVFASTFSVCVCFHYCCRKQIHTQQEICALSITNLVL